MADGRIFPKASPGAGMSVKELLMQGDLVPITVKLSRPPLAERTGVPFIANFAEVEVDTSTGRTQVLKLVVVNDCGTVMYASGAEAQQIGGQVIGVGEALTEEIIYDQATGVPAQLQLDRLQDPDHGRHARHRPGAPGGVAGRRRVRRLRHRRGHADLHARGRS